MAYFRWVGLNEQGVEATGLVAAPTIEAAHVTLMYRQLIILELEPTKDQAARQRKNFLNELITKLALFTSHGLPLHQALEIIATQTQDPYNQANLATLLIEVRRGQSLAESLEVYFPETSSYILALLQSGEESGKIAIVLNLLSNHLEEASQQHKKIMGVVTPPLLTLFFTSAILMILLIGVVPQFEQLFITLEKPMPPATAALVAFAHLWTNPFFIFTLLAGVSTLYLFYKTLKKRPSFQTQYDAAILKLPIIGSFLIKLALSKYLNLLGILSDAALPLYRASDLASRSVSHTIIRRWLQAVTVNLKKGDSFLQSVKSAGPAPDHALLDLLVPTVTLGVKQKTLQLAAHSLEQEGLKSLSRLIALVGPTLLVVVGGIIFLILIFLYLPLFNLANTV